MLYKETVCPVCNGHGFLSGGDDHSVWSKPCTNHCHNGLVAVPMTNGDLFRKCTNEQIVKVLSSLTKYANDAGRASNSFLLFWLDKETSELDLETVFDFINRKDYEHPWLRVNAL